MTWMESPPRFEKCSCCGLLLDPDRHRYDLGFQLPDPVSDLPPGERAERIAGGKVLISVEGLGNFVRVILPVRLTGGYEVVFGCWIHVDPEQYEHASRIWEDPAYSNLILRGHLANRIDPWLEVIGSEVIARPRSENELPYIVESADPLTQRVITEVWPHSEVFAAWPRHLPQAPTQVWFRVIKDRDGHPPDGTESVSATRTGEGYVIDSIPFFARQASFGDVVGADEIDGRLWFTRTVRSSRNSVLRVTVLDVANVDEVELELHDRGCSTEVNRPLKLIAISVPSEAKLLAVQSYVNAARTAGRVDFEETILYR